jgi:hypothetical protein
LIVDFDDFVFCIFDNLFGGSSGLIDSVSEEVFCLDLGVDQGALEVSCVDGWDGNSGYCRDRSDECAGWCAGRAGEEGSGQDLEFMLHK